MEQPHSATPATESTRELLEQHIAAAVRHSANPVEGIFGQNSITWRINRESALFLGAGRAALLQLAHPWVASALDQHSTLMAKPIARFHNTFRVVFTMIFGTTEQAVRAASSLHRIHTQITGTLPDDVGVYARASRYEALHIPALLWVYATLIESAVMAYECVMPPLSAGELACYYAESKTLAGLFGLPPESLPADWNAFQNYVADISGSPALGVSDRARIMGRNIMIGAGSRIPIPRWYQSLTTEWLPPRFRDEFAFPWESCGQTSARARQRLPRIYGKLPAALRYVGPYQEAQARLAGRNPGMLSRRINRFWIGQPLMPFSS